LATIKLNGVDTTLSSITGTNLNDKLTASGSSVDSITAALAEGKDLVEISAEKDGFEAVSNNMTVNAGAGADVISATDGLVTVTGKLNGGGGADSIDVARSSGATLQGGQGNDVIGVGSADALNGAGSRADTTIESSSVLGGGGSDQLHIHAAAKATDSSFVGGVGADVIDVAGSVTGSTGIVEASNGTSTTVSASSILKGGSGKDHIMLRAGATLTNTFVTGNNNVDVIEAGGALADTTGSLISGGGGNDVISVAAAGSMTVRGGGGKDVLRVGSGQTVSGNAGADVFSVESKGGVTITDYDALDEDCFCSDVIQVDGNKLAYATYDYKPTKELYTSASSWKGNIKVKAVAEAVTCNVGTNFTYNAQKTASIDATAVAVYKATEYKPSLKNNTLDANYPDPKFPAKGTYIDGKNNAVTFNANGNSPRTAKDVAGIGFGFGSVTGYITNRGLTQAGDFNFRSIALNNLTVYTNTKFEKGDFSFLNLTKNANDDCKLKQTLTFNKVSQATITNHWASFGVSKKVASSSLYALKLGTNNFDTFLTGKGNLIITNVKDQTFVPTLGQLTDPKLTKFTRTKSAATAGKITLDLDGTFDLFTQRNGRVATALQTNKVAHGTNGAAPALVGKGTAGGFFKYDINSYDQAQKYGLLTLTVATAMDGQVATTKFTPKMNTNSVFGMPATKFVGASGGARDTQTATGKLVAKIFVQETATANGKNAGLDTWVKRAIIPGQTFDVTSNCSFPSTLAGNVAVDGANNNGKYTPAKTADGADGAFGKQYIWTDNALQINKLTNIAATWGSANKSNGCADTAFNCSSMGRGFEATPEGGRHPVANTYNSLGVSAGYGNAKQVFDNLNLVSANNQGAFSGSAFNVKELAEDGMGDNVVGTYAGAPFRILFFDTKGSDNGLYMYSGTANYKNGAVTAINTNPDAASAMGTKQTIVKVSGGKGHEIALSDINLV